MNWYRELQHKLLHLPGRDRFDEALNQEMEAHLEMRADELEAAGMPRKDALLQARREFGSRARAAEQVREAWRWGWIEDAFRDLRYASRALARDPGFAAAAVVSLALGIGVNMAIFSLTTEFLFSEPSARDASQLVSVRLGGNSHVSLSDYRFLREAGVFGELAGMNESQVNWRAGDTSVRIFPIRITKDFFEATGIPVAMGRPIQTGESNVTVVSHRFWNRRLNSDPGVIGRVLLLDGIAYTVVGVLPDDHRTLIGFGYAPDLYLPITSEETNVSLWARLQPGQNTRQAAAQVTAAGERLDHADPNPHFKRGRNVTVTGLVGPERLMKKNALMSVTLFFAVLLIVVGLILVIACANVAGLLLARASGRLHEFALRLSIGASRGRLIRQLLAESLLLASLGTLAGLLLHLWLTSILNNLELPLPVPVKLAIRPDTPLLIYSIVIAFVSAILAGLAPALKATRNCASGMLKSEEHQVRGGRAGMRNLIVAGQLAVSTLVLITASLFVRNLILSTEVDPGFDLQNTIWAEMRLVEDNYKLPGKTIALANTALDAVRALPGVEAASVAESVPLNHNNMMRASLRTDLKPELVPIAYSLNRVGPDYFRTMGIPLIAGREFVPADRSGSPKVAIVSQEFARRLFGEENAVGRRFSFDRDPITIVGVVRNSKFNTLGENDRALLYESILQAGRQPNLQFMVRGLIPPDQLIQSIHRTLLATDQMAAVETRRLSSGMALALLPSRIGAALLGLLGALGLILAAVGFYGVLAYSVSRRIREIGLRVAMGAQSGDILRMVLREGAWILLLGIGTGAGIAFIATKPLASLLVPGLQPDDPLTYSAVLALLFAVGCAASLIPAFKALRVDPSTALRYE